MPSDRRATRFAGGVVFLFLISFSVQADPHALIPPIFRRTEPKPASIRIAKRLLNNELYFNSSWPAVKYGKNVDWSANPHRDPTWQFYLHSLDLVGHLANAYELEGDDAYLRKGKELILSWIEANTSRLDDLTWWWRRIINGGSNFSVLTGSYEPVWSDHAAANRVVNLLHFRTVCTTRAICDGVFESTLKKVLEEHGKYLRDDRYYNAEGNHGLFQDQALIELSLLMPEGTRSQRDLAKATDRFLRHVRRDVTPSGIHKEHSPSYHVTVLTLLKETDQFLEFHSKRIEELRTVISKMESYVAHVLQPGGRVPNIGDSQPSVFKCPPMETLVSQELMFFCSKGKKGKKPAAEIVYPDAGVAIFREEGSSPGPLFLMFTAGFHSKIHKHADDLSFILTRGGRDLLVDSGKYNYDEGDPFRQYFRSSFAHNTLTVDDRTYPMNEDQVGKSRIETYGIGPTYSYVVGSHDLYPGVTVRRTLLYVKTGSVVLRDETHSSREHRVSQSFNLDDGVEALHEGNRLLLKDKGGAARAEIIQTSPVANVTIREGMTRPVRGWLSRGFRKKTPIVNIEYENVGSALQFATIINTAMAHRVTALHIREESGIQRWTLGYEDGRKLEVALR